MGRLDQAETWRTEKGDGREQQATEQLRLRFKVRFEEGGAGAAGSEVPCEWGATHDCDTVTDSRNSSVKL
jgi:hypothetical protein